MDLLDILGGQDNLRLMCEAREFYINWERGFVRFKTNGKYVWLTKCLGGIGVYIWEVKTKNMLLQEVAGTEEEVIGLFERYTGLTLSF